MVDRRLVLANGYAREGAVTTVAGRVEGSRPALEWQVNLGVQVGGKVGQ